MFDFGTNHLRSVPSPQGRQSREVIVQHTKNVVVGKQERPATATLPVHCDYLELEATPQPECHSGPFDSFRVGPAAYGLATQHYPPHAGVPGIAGDTIEGACIPRGGPGVGPGGAVGACVQVREGAELGTRGEGSQCSRRQGYSDRDHDGTVIMGSLRKCKGACSSLSR